MLLRKEDMVLVTVGDDHGKRGRVLDVDREQRKVLVEGINRAYKHVRRSQKNPQGGRLSKEMPIQAANVQLICPLCNQATRLGVKFNADGSKSRVCKKCTRAISQVSPPRAAIAKRGTAATS